MSRACARADPPRVRAAAIGRRRWLLGLVALVCVMVLASCGSATPKPSRAGAPVFATDCSQCHSLIGNESLRRQGGDLLGYRFSRKDLLSFTREMPVRHPLSAAQLADVVDYVLAVQRRRG